MSHFHDRFKQHGLHNTLKALVESMEAADLELADPRQVDGYARFRRVVDFASRTISTIDPDLIGENALNGLNNVLTKIKVQFDAFVSSKNWQQLNQPADELLDQLYRLPRLKFPRGQDAFASALEDYRAQAETLLNGLKAKADNIAQRHDEVKQTLGELTAKVSRFDQQFEQQKGRIDNLINQQQAQSSQNQSDRQTKFTEQQNQFAQTNKERLDQLDQQRNQSKQEADRLLKELRQHGEKAIEQGQAKLDVVRAKLDEDAANARQALQSQLDDAEKIVGLIGNTGLTGNYQRIANEQARFANLFRWVALGLMAGGIIVVAIVVSNVAKDDFSWEVGIFRLLCALAFIGPAIYCAHESGRHRRIEQRNRQVELELASLSPYLAELTDEERKKIVAELSKQYFGREPAPLSEDDILRKVKHMKGEDVLKLFERLAKIVKP